MIKLFNMKTRKTQSSILNEASLHKHIAVLSPCLQKKPRKNKSLTSPLYPPLTNAFNFSFSFLLKPVYLSNFDCTQIPLDIKNEGLKSQTYRNVLKLFSRRNWRSTRLEEHFSRVPGYRFDL